MGALRFRDASDAPDDPFPFSSEWSCVDHEHVHGPEELDTFVRDRRGIVTSSSSRSIERVQFDRSVFWLRYRRESGDKWNGSVGAVDDRLGDLWNKSYHDRLHSIQRTSLDRQANLSSIFSEISLVLVVPPARLIASNQGGAHQTNHETTHRYPTALHIILGA